MKAKGIVFIPPLVRAIKAGLATQTRRIAKIAGPVAVERGQKLYLKLRDQYAARMDDQHGLMWIPYGGATERPMPPDVVADLAPWRIGQHLWVKESWRNGPGGYCYRADQTHDGYGGGQWKSPLFMPRRVSRFNLVVTGVGMERVNGISDLAAQASGLRIYGEGPLQALANLFVLHPEMTVPEIIEGHGVGRGHDGKYCIATWAGVYACLWDHLHAKEPQHQWAANPPVWRIEFALQGKGEGNGQG